MDGNQAVTYVFETAAPDIWQNGSLVLGDSSFQKGLDKSLNIYPITLWYIYSAAQDYPDIIGMRKYLEAIDNWISEHPTCGGVFSDIQSYSSILMIMERTNFERREIETKEEYQVAKIDIVFLTTDGGGFFDG